MASTDKKNSNSDPNANADEELADYRKRHHEAYMQRKKEQERETSETAPQAKEPQVVSQPQMPAVVPQAKMMTAAPKAQMTVPQVPQAPQAAAVRTTSVTPKQVQSTSSSSSSSSTAELEEARRRQEQMLQDEKLARMLEAEEQRPFHVIGEDEDDEDLRQAREIQEQMDQETARMLQEQFNNEDPQDIGGRAPDQSYTEQLLVPPMVDQSHMGGAGYPIGHPAGPPMGNQMGTQMGAQMGTQMGAQMGAQMGTQMGRQQQNAQSILAPPRLGAQLFAPPASPTSSLSCGSSQFSSPASNNGGSRSRPATGSSVNGAPTTLEEEERMLKEAIEKSRKNV